MMRSLLHFGHRSASRLVTQAVFGCSWAAALLCAPLMVAAGWQGAIVTLTELAFLNLHFILPLRRPRVDVTHTTICTIHRAIRLGFRRDLGYALTMAVLRYLIVVAAFNHYGQFEAVAALHMYLIARIFDFWNWDNLVDKWRALHIK